MTTKIITYCSDVVKYRARLPLHYTNDIGLKHHIRTNAKRTPLNLNPPTVPTEFWINPFKIDVLYKGNESFTYSKVPEHIALGVRDEDGNVLVPSVVDALNINPLNGQYELVLEVWGIGEVGGENCIFEALSDERKAKLREFNPEVTMYTDDEGNQVEQHNSLIPRFLT